MNLLETLKERARNLRSDIGTLYCALQHPEVGPAPKLLFLATVAYALSPVDLIPDFIPVLGYIDDLIILPAMIALSIKLIPRRILEECRTKTKENPPELRGGIIFTILIVLLWALVLLLLLRSIIRRFGG